MAAAQMSPQEEQAALAKLRDDPNFQQLLTSPGSAMVKNQRINDYIFNDPRSPLAGINAAQSPSGSARGAYHYDDQTGELRYVDTYGHPTAMKIIGIGATLGMGGLAAAGALGGGAGAAGAGAGAGATGAGAAGVGATGAGAAGAGGAGAAGAGLLASAPTATGFAPLAAPVAASGVGGAAGGSALGGILSNPDTWRTVGALAGGAANGMAGEREGRMDAESRQHQTSQNALVNLLGLQERGTMDRAEMGLRAPGQRTRQAVLGSLLQNLQPMNIQAPAGVRMGQVSGGLSPALLNPQARQAGGELQRQALMALMNKSDVPAPTNYPQSGMLPAPSYRGAGTAESILSMLGIGGSAIGAMRGGR